MNSHECASPRNATWLQPLRDWPRALIHALQTQSSVARVVLADVRGSTPREAGVCMLVGVDTNTGTIGGGQLEWQAIQAARSLLMDAASPTAKTQRFTLATQLGQCCGGVVELWLERYTRADQELLETIANAASCGPACLQSTIVDAHLERRLLAANVAIALPRVTLSHTARNVTTFRERLDTEAASLYLYGAGHVGQALVRILADLPLQVTWVDSRADLLPAHVAGSVRVLHTPVPLATVATAPARARFLVMTHSHALDYELCRRILERDDAAWVGLIGSKSKAARFRSRLARDDLSAERIARLVCPIGIEGIASKWPAAIAVAVAAQLLQGIDSNEADDSMPRELLVRQAADTDCPQDGCVACQLLHRSS